ncbi:MAG: hypothetical protein D8M55_12580 [Chloroflexi bacterium]|nr:hypothetical protein [Chloroflexota bacterium]MDL1927014.1 nucleotidyl transferase AbiEii/AbiGii toxin family protein [Anaerolineae bacterium AMX1]
MLRGRQRHHSAAVVPLPRICFAEIQYPHRCNLPRHGNHRQEHAADRKLSRHILVSKPARGFVSRLHDLRLFWSQIRRSNIGKSHLRLSLPSSALERSTRSQPRPGRGTTPQSRRCGGRGRLGVFLPRRAERRPQDENGCGKFQEACVANLVQTLQHVLTEKDPALANETKRILLKSALQAFTLDFLYNHPIYRGLNFYGGTCLHVVYGLNRLSEDLDLDNGHGIDLASLSNDVLAFFHKTHSYSEAAVKTQNAANGILRITLKFPVLNALGLSNTPNEALHLKMEATHHKQVAVIKKTPVLYYGRSIVPAHFSLETMMAGKMIACLERNFQRGRADATLKGRDFYDLLWFMQKRIEPLKEKLAKDGKKEYTPESAMAELKAKIQHIRKEDLAIDLLPLFESRVFIEAWLDGFHENFDDLMAAYL